jgi:hypothetical protein
MGLVLQFQANEIKSFPHLVKKSQRCWIYGYEEVDDACLFLDIQDKIVKKIDDLIMKYNDNAPIDLLMEIEKIKDAYFFLCDYIEAKYGEPSLVKLEDDLHKEVHPSPPSHEPLLHNMSELENDEELMPHVENVKEM